MISYYLNKNITEELESKEHQNSQQDLIYKILDEQASPSLKSSDKNQQETKSSDKPRSTNSGRRPSRPTKESG